MCTPAACSLPKLKYMKLRESFGFAVLCVIGSIREACDFIYVEQSNTSLRYILPRLTSIWDEINVSTH